MRNIYHQVTSKRTILKRRKREMLIQMTHIVMTLHRRREMLMQRCMHLNLSDALGERGQSQSGQKTR
jgi:hypothetical protein